MQQYNFIFDCFTIFFLLFGMFFMTVAALGLLRMPDFYHRMHAATKGVTLGLSGLLLAGAFQMLQQHDVTPLAVITRFMLAITFIFIANPVGAHLLAKAAHKDNCPMWEGTLSDELADDRENDLV